MRFGWSVFYFNSTGEVNCILCSLYKWITKKGGKNWLAETRRERGRGRGRRKRKGEYFPSLWANIHIIPHANKQRKSTAMLGYASLSQVLPRKTQHVSPLSLLTAAKSFKCQGPLLSLDVDITKHGRDKRWMGLHFCRLDITVVIKMVSFLLLLVLSFVTEVAFAGEAKWREDNKRAYGRAPANVLSA